MKPARLPVRLCAAAAALAATTLTVTACSSGTPGGSGSSATVLLPVEARGLDPTVASPQGIADGDRLAALYDVLFWTDPATGRVNPGIGESLTTTDGGTTWTMKLRPGVTFSDGTPFDADAVAFNYQRHADPALHSLQQTSVRGMTEQTVDPLTLRMTLSAPNMEFDKLVAKNLTYIASPAALRAHPQDYSAHPVGAGPFVLKQWVHNDHMTFVRNPRYWQHGEPHLDRLTFKVVPDTQQELDAVHTGRATALVTPDYQLVDQARKDSLGVDETQLSGGKMITFNTAKPPFDDPRARRVIALALSAKNLTDTVYDGQGTVAQGLFAPGSQFDDTATAMPGDDLTQAQQLADQLAAEGYPLSFTFTTYQSPPSVKTAEYIQTQLSRVKGVHMDIETLEPGLATVKTQVNRNFQASLFTLWIDDPEPVLYNFLRSGAPGDWTGYTNAAVDRALDQARATADPATRAQAYAVVQQQVDNDLPVWVFQNATAAIVHARTLTGVTVFNEGTVLFDRVSM